MALLLHGLLFALALAALHLGLSARGPLPVTRFCAAAATAHVVIGMLVALPALLGQAGRSWTAAWWLPAWALGLFATGGLLGAAWWGTVRGIERLLRRGTDPGPGASP